MLFCCAWLLSTLALGYEHLETSSLSSDFKPRSESFYKLTDGKGFSLYSTYRASALQTVTKSVYLPDVCPYMYIYQLSGVIQSAWWEVSTHMGRTAWRSVNIRLHLHAYIHTYRCSGQVSSQETSHMNPASTSFSQWTSAFAFVTAYEPIYRELCT